MRSLVRTLIVVFAFLLLSSFAASGSSAGRVCFYEHKDFQGSSECYDTGSSVSWVGHHWNDRWSSIKIYGEATVTVYEDINFGGRARTFNRSSRWVGDFWNDRISSFQISSSTPSRSHGGRVCFYEHINFGGMYECYDAGSSIAWVGHRWNDCWSSIKIHGRLRVTVYEDKDFHGRSRTFYESTPWVGHDWNDIISSFQVSP